jgi:hypothetical protein
MNEKQPTIKDMTETITNNINPLPTEPNNSSSILNTIIPIISFILFIILLCHTLMKYGLIRYFNIKNLNSMEFIRKARTVPRCVFI